MKTEIKTTKKERDALGASNTEALQTVPGSERIIADSEDGEPVVHIEKSATKAFKKTENLAHIGLANTKGRRRE